MQKNNLPAIVGMITLIVASGYFRENVFLSINEVLRYKWYGGELPRVSEFYSILNHFSAENLLLLKWPLTLIFSGLFFAETIVMNYLIFKTSFIREVAFVYLLLIGISGIVYGTFHLVGKPSDGYLIARFLMGIAQSAVPMMILIPAIYLKGNAFKPS